MKKVAVFGATGNLGPFVIPTLLANSSRLRVTIFSRSWKAAHEQFQAGWTKQGAICQELNPDDQEALTRALKGLDTCVALVGGAAFAWQEKLIQACKDAGVKRILLSEFGFPNEMKALNGLPLLEERRRIVEVARRSGVEYVALATGGFFDFIFTPFWGWDLDKHEATIWGTPQTRFSCISRLDVGKLIEKVILMDKLPANDMSVQADAPTFQQMIDTWERLSGEKIKVKTVTLEETKKAMETSRDVPAAYAVAQIHYGVAAGANDYKPSHNEAFANVNMASFEENLRQLLRK